MKGLLFTIFALAALMASAQTDHTNHNMADRGNQGMGFAQSKTTHHFLLRKDGGAIQVTAKSVDDKASGRAHPQALGTRSRRVSVGGLQHPRFRT